MWVSKSLGRSVWVFFSPCIGISQPTQQIQKQQLLGQVDTIQTEIPKRNQKLTMFTSRHKIVEFLSSNTKQSLQNDLFDMFISLLWSCSWGDFWVGMEIHRQSEISFSTRGDKKLNHIFFMLTMGVDSGGEIAFLLRPQLFTSQMKTTPPCCKGK